MTPDQFLARMKKGNVAPAYLFLGTEAYGRDRCRKALDYFAHAGSTRAIIERIAKEQPATLACMHGSAWTGDGAALLRALADRVA